jgi:hypothetical protein
MRVVTQIGAQDVALERETGKLSFTNDTDQACGLQLLHVMGECCGANAVSLLKVAAGHRISTAAYFF